MTVAASVALFVALLVSTRVSATTSFAAPDDHAGLAFVPPPQFIEDHTLGPPDLSQTPQSRVSEWRSWASAPGGPRLFTGCFETPTDAWAPEAEPLALDKMAQIAASTAIRAGLGGQLGGGENQREGDVVMRDLVGDGTARVFLAFVRGSRGFVLTSCFAMCTSPSASSEGDPAPKLSRDCGPAIRMAHMRGPIVRAPEPSAGVRALLAMVHHPTFTTLAICGTACLAGAVAVITRKRPRSRNRKQNSHEG